MLLSTLALKVTVSLVAFPRVVFPLTIKFSSTVKSSDTLTSFVFKNISSEASFKLAISNLVFSPLST